MKHSIVHRALLDFLLYCDETSRAVSHPESQFSISLSCKCLSSVMVDSFPCYVQEVIELLREMVVEILHTRDGSRVALHCLWHGTAKVQSCITA